MKSVSTLCFFLPIISYITAFDDVPYSNISVHSWLKQDPRYSKFGFEHIFSGLNLRTADLIKENYTHSDIDPAILKTGHVWGDIDLNTHRKKRDSPDLPCNCETEFNLLTPVTVEYNGKTYEVYQPDRYEYQVFYFGECVNRGKSCGAESIGTCTEGLHSRTDLVLVVDPDLPEYFFPKVRFIPMALSNHCFCNNP